MNLELTRAGDFTPKDVLGHAVDSSVHLGARVCAGARRVVGSLLLFLVARPIVRRLNLGMRTMPAVFKLVGTQTSTTGTLLHVYRAAGSLKYGSFMLEPPTTEAMARRAGVSPGPR